jgi:hypothetical protein
MIPSCDGFNINSIGQQSRTQLGGNKKKIYTKNFCFGGMTSIDEEMEGGGRKGVFS